MDRLYICYDCKRMSLIYDICSNCLREMDSIEMDGNKVEIKVIESSYSSINNARFGLVEIRFGDMRERVFKRLD